MTKKVATKLIGSVTINDVARLANVHPSTVSRALRNVPGKVSDQKRQEIRSAALSLGYQPNSIAASLRTKQTDIAAIIVPDISNPLFAPIVQTLERSLREQKILTLVAQTPEDAEARYELMQTLLSRQIRGLLILAAESQDPMLDLAAERNIPTVLINRGQAEERFFSVINDDTKSIELALAHLNELNHRCIAHIAGPSSSSTGAARRIAFENLTTQKNWQNCSVIEAKGFTRHAGAEATKQLLRHNPDITAIVAANDLIALGAMDVLREKGLQIPHDISVIGHNNMLFSDALSPALTTIHVEAEGMGLKAAKILFMLIQQGHCDKPRTFTLRPQLIIRDSTGLAR